MLPRDENTCIMCCTLLLHGGNQQAKMFHHCILAVILLGVILEQVLRKDRENLTASFNLVSQFINNSSHLEKDFDPCSSKVWQELTNFL